MGVLCCFALFVCLTLLASFFLPSHLSFQNMYIQCSTVLVEYLYQNGAKLTLNDERGRGCLHYATQADDARYMYTCIVFTLPTTPCFAMSWFLHVHVYIIVRRRVS